MRKAQKTSIVILLALILSLWFNNTYALTAEEELSNLFAEIVNGTWTLTETWDLIETVTEEDTSTWETEEILTWAVITEETNIIINQDTEETEEIELNSAWEEPITTNNVELETLPTTWPTELLLLLISLLIAWVLFYNRKSKII